MEDPSLGKLRLDEIRAANLDHELLSTEDTDKRGALSPVGTKNSNIYKKKEVVKKLFSIFLKINYHLKNNKIQKIKELTK